MIKFTNDINQIANIWIEAFGDSFDDVAFFENNLKNGKCLGYYINEKLVSMLYLVDCKLNDEDNYYVYAACTLKDFRGNGYMKNLLDYVKDTNGKVCLIPANEGLIDYYKNNGLDSFSSIEDLSFDECDALINDYLYVGCDLEKPVVQHYKGE